MKVAVLDYHKDCVEPLLKELNSFKHDLLKHHDFVVVKIRTSSSGKFTKLICAVLVSSNICAQLGSAKLSSLFKEQFPNVQIRYDILFRTFYLRGIDAFEVGAKLRLLNIKS